MFQPSLWPSIILAIVIIIMLILGINLYPADVKADKKDKRPEIEKIEERSL